jgi:putative transcriptional regulator
MCDNNRPLKKLKVTHKYKECGLDNVTLSGVEYSRCDKCGEEYYGFGNMEKLNQAISSVLLRKKNFLTGNEVRFLRKHLGYSGVIFAKIIGYDASTLSRIERGLQPVTKAFDRLIRFIVVSKLPDRNYDLHDQILKNDGLKLDRIELTSTKHGEWKLKAA